MLRKTVFVVLVLLSCTGSTYAQSKNCPRIISQSPYITGMLDFLGMKQCIVGVSRYSDLDLPRTGGIYDPDGEAIDSLMPDLIITSAWTKEDVLQKVTPEGVKAIRLHSFQKVTQLEENMRTIMAVTGWHQAEAKVDEYAKQLESKISQVEGNDKEILLVSSCSNMPYSYGRNTRMYDLFSRAGFKVMETEEKIHHIRPGNPVDNLNKLMDKYQPDLVFVLQQKKSSQCQLLLTEESVSVINLPGELFLLPTPVVLQGLDLLISKKYLWQ